MMNLATHVPVALLCFAVAASPVAAADVLTQHNNNGRTGAILDETRLTTATVNSNRFGRLWSLFADGQVVAQPLYVTGLPVDTMANPAVPRVRGVFNAVVVATMHNTVYVYDADRENRGPDGRTIPLWAKWLGQPRPGSKDIDMWSTNDPEWGIVSTPVISDDHATLFLVAWHDDGPAGFNYKLHALRLKDGMDRTPPVVVGVPSTDPSDPCANGQKPFDPCRQKQRTAMLLSNGVLYFAFGGDGNRGALYAFDAATLTQRAVWVSTPTGVNGGMWQSGQGLVADEAGDIYVMTGNGSVDRNEPRANFGSSFVRLRLEGANLVVKDYFTPCNFQFLNDTDLDVGSAGPLLVPGTPRRIVSGGKEGVLYVLPADNLGKLGAMPATGPCQNAPTVQQILAFDPVSHGGKTHYGNIHGSPVYWKGPDAGRIYAWGENSALKAFRFAVGRFQDPANATQSAFRPPDGMPGGMLAISANGDKAGSGIVWAVTPLDGDANEQRGVKGIVLALDAQNVSRTLWTSEQVAGRDRLGLFAKFTNPMIAAGKVFVPTYGDEETLQRYPKDPVAVHPTRFPRNYSVAVYGLFPANPAIVNQASGDITVLRATTGPLILNTANCVTIDANSIDCTNALAQAAGAPSFHRVLLAAGANPAGCQLARVTTASPDAALATATGIGFWSASVAAGNTSAEDAGLFVEKSRLVVAGQVTLKGGAPATLHDFAGLVNCPGAVALGRQFKPYLQFETPDQLKIFRNWDKAANQLLDATSTRIDRSADVLP